MALGIGCVGGCIYYGHSQDKPKNVNWCSQIAEFDTIKHKFTTAYCQSTIYDDDSVVNFTTKYGKAWWHKDYADDSKQNNEDGIQYDDITLKNGQHYRVLAVSEDGCKIRQKEDELLNNLSKNEAPQDNN